MAYLGLLIYIVLIFIRPADWVPMMLGWPLEFISLGATIACIAVTLIQGTDDRPLYPQVPFLLLWVTAIFLSDASNGHFSEAVDQAVIYGKRALIFVAFWMAINSARKLRIALLLLVVLAGALGLQGMYQKEHGVGWAGQPLYWSDRICWVGLWDGANVLSLLFVFTIPFVLEIVLGKWNVLAKCVAAGCGVLILYGLILAASRGAWLSLGVILLLYFTRRVGKLGVVIAAVAIVGLLAIGPDRLTRDDNRDDSSSRHRVDMWAEGIEMLKYNPVFGIGKGQFLNYTGMLIAHNSYVQNMGETGLLGMFAWIGLIYISLKCLHGVTSRAEELDERVVSMAQAAFVSLAGYMSASMFITTDFDLLYILLGICAAIFAVARLEGDTELNFEFTGRDMRNIACLVLAVVTGMYVVTRTLS